MAKLYFYYSTMNAGKSTTLLQSSYNYRERNMNTMVYTAAIDDRFGAGKVTSRIGIHEEANLFTSTSDLFAEVSQRLQQEKIHCVLVDEAQFFGHTKLRDHTSCGIGYLLDILRSSCSYIIKN